MSDGNDALWLPSAMGRLSIGPAPMPEAGPGEVVVRARAVAVNPVDAVPGIAHRVITPWLTYPAVLGTDVAGDVIAVGPDVTRIAVGDRVLGHAAGQERSRNRAAEGAFQRFVVLLERLCSPIPDALPFEAAVVLPLALSTAAAGLFEPDQLGLAAPTSSSPASDDVVLVWGGSTSVGANAIQLARSAGYAVLATASPRNAAYVAALGAEASFDYRDPHAVDAIVAAVGGRALSGTIAIGAGSLPAAIRIARAARGPRRVASAAPTPPTRVRGALARRHGVHVTAIWGGTPVDSAVGPAVYADFLPSALAEGRYRAAPDPLVAGHGLAAIPAALDRLRAGVSAQKVVVTL